jgi:aldehyde:ferredoxin oxidoreductase
VLLNDMILRVARREGLGDLLAEGALRAARTVGRDTERYVVHIKGLEMAMHDPRGMERMRLNYPVTPTGGDHTGAAHHRTSNRNTVGLCQFLAYDEDRVANLLNGATGWDTTVGELEEQSSRGLTMARLFNLREGIGAKDDVFPERIHQPIRRGPLSTYEMPREQIVRENADYYHSHGWDRSNGVPLAETIEYHGLGSYVGFLGDVPRGSGELPFRKTAGTAVAEKVEE